MGSNIEPERNIRKGIQTMKERFGELFVSPVYESEPVGFKGDNFYNLVIGFDSEETYSEIAAALHEIEAMFGRSRSNGRLSSRTLDLDLLLYGDLVIKEENIQLPRDDVIEYAFVLQPLAELAGDQLHPEIKRSYRDLWNAFDRNGQILWQIDFDLD